MNQITNVIIAPATTATISTMPRAIAKPAVVEKTVAAVVSVTIVPATHPAAALTSYMTADSKNKPSQALISYINCSVIIC